MPLSDNTVLIVEDNARDAHLAARIAKELNAAKVDVQPEFLRASIAFQQIEDGRRTAPDLIVLDLLLGNDSGFELLRLWKSNKQRFTGTRMVVWTVLEDRHLELARYFGAEVVSKKDGEDGLRAALRGMRAANG